MKRVALAFLMGACLALITGVPAWAQYGGGGGGTTTTTTSTTAPGGGEPDQPRTEASVSDDDVEPGDTVTVSAPPVFAPGSPITVNLVRAQSGADAQQLATGTAGANGSASQSVTIPQVPDGVYFVYITGKDADGNDVVAMAAIVVRGGVAAPAAVQGNAAAVPAPVAQAQGVAPDTEAAVVDAVTDGAGVVLSPQGQLQVRTAAGLQDASTLPTTGSDDISKQVTVGAALLLAGTGLVVLRRRRTGGFAK